MHVPALMPQAARVSLDDLSDACPHSTDVGLWRYRLRRQVHGRIAVHETAVMPAVA